MNLTTIETEEVRELISRNEFSTVSCLAIERISLGAAIELACLRFLMNGNKSVCEVLNKWARNAPILAAAFDSALRARIPERHEIFTARTFEFFPVSRRNWEDNDHHLFEGRFDAALRSAGFGKTSKALVGALNEMADNILQHSGTSTDHPASGFMGYHVTDGIMSYGVGDVGRGVLESLKENPDWRELAESVDAIEAIVTKHASRRPLGGDGGGFKQFFKSLADFNGQIVLRSGDGVMRIRGSPDGRKAEKGLITPLKGLQISVTCSLQNQPREHF